MRSEPNPQPQNSRAQIAHVLFLDIVGYSRETTTTQGKRIAKLNEVVNGTAAFTESRDRGAAQPIPTGDGMAILFYDDVTAPVRCAIAISQALGAEVPLRMGIHSGLVQRQMDIAGHENVVGEGINTAQRVLDFGETGHILLSAQYANWLLQFDEWVGRVEPLGEGVAKHGLQLTVYTLRGDGFGSAERPAKIVESAPAKSASTKKSSSGGPKVVLLYKRNAQPDENLLTFVEEQLTADGHEVYVDRGRKIGPKWAQDSEERIRESDAVVAIVSPKSLQSEMLEYELETANDQAHRTGKPLILPIRVGGEDDSIGGPVLAIVQPLNQFIWQGDSDNHRLVAELISAIREPLKPRVADVKLEPVGGAVPPDSPFYIERASDTEMVQALDARESILLIKGARQMGKTSMQARAAQRARGHGWRVALTDFQKLNSAQMADENAFYRIIAATLARQLKFSYDFATEWDEIFGANLNMENFLRELLDSQNEQLVWCMDEVDKLFAAPFASDFFGLVRSWHNSRSTEPDGPWGKLTVIIAYATEAHLFIQDLNQSPFNVGRRLEMEDFNLQQFIDLNGRYGSPLHSYDEAQRLHAYIGGQPFLSRRALDVLATGRWDFQDLMEQAGREDGPFSDHLKRILVSVSRFPEVAAFAKSVLAGTATANGGDQTAFYRLLAAGIVRQENDGRIEFRTALYREYLAGHLV